MIIKITKTTKKLYPHKTNNVLMTNEFVRYCLHLSGYTIRTNRRKNRNTTSADELIIAIYRTNNATNNTFPSKNLSLSYILTNNDITTTVRSVIARLQIVIKVGVCKCLLQVIYKMVVKFPNTPRDNVQYNIIVKTLLSKKVGPGRS